MHDSKTWRPRSPLSGVSTHLRRRRYVDLHSSLLLDSMVPPPLPHLNLRCLLQMDSASWCPGGCGTLFKYLVFPRRNRLWPPFPFLRSLLPSLILNSPTLTRVYGVVIAPGVIVPSLSSSLPKIFRIIYFARYRRDARLFAFRCSLLLSFLPTIFVACPPPLLSSRSWNFLFLFG